MAQIKNVSGEDRLVPALGGRLVIDGAVIEVPDEEVPGFLCQPATWADPEPPKPAAKKATSKHDEKES